VSSKRELQRRLTTTEQTEEIKNSALLCCSVLFPLPAHRHLPRHGPT